MGKIAFIENKPVGVVQVVKGGYGVRKVRACRLECILSAFSAAGARGVQATMAVNQGLVCPLPRQTGQSPGAERQ